MTLNPTYQRYCCEAWAEPAAVHLVLCCNGQVARQDGMSGPLNYTLKSCPHRDL